MNAMESMVGDLDTWIPDIWWGTHTWWGTHMHGGEPTHMAAWPAFVGRQVRGPRGVRPLDHVCGLMWAPCHGQVPHNVSGIQVSRSPTMDFMVSMDSISLISLFTNRLVYSD